MNEDLVTLKLNSNLYECGFGKQKTKLFSSKRAYSKAYCFSSPYSMSLEETY